ncbi:hypothetical protein CMV_012736 [Castanea mollissima]|uniref:Histone H2A C-terminal domain-containing protein n=1 Tax=Castanea mollissima TaxID=60419 RepID=A0A8J4VMP5_9ROSI|nr:hypothetical protein CMV_012736 [Castanea mollissima]
MWVKWEDVIGNLRLGGEEFSYGWNVAVFDSDGDRDVGVGEGFKDVRVDIQDLDAVDDGLGFQEVGNLGKCSLLQFPKHIYQYIFLMDSGTGSTSSSFPSSNFGYTYDVFLSFRGEDTHEVNNWRAALVEVTNIAGWDLRDRSESPVIEEIVRKIYVSNVYDLVVPGRKLPKWFSYQGAGASVTLPVPPNFDEKCLAIGMCAAFEHLPSGLGGLFDSGFHDIRRHGLYCSIALHAESGSEILARAEIKCISFPSSENFGPVESGNLWQIYVRREFFDMMFDGINHYEIEDCVLELAGNAARDNKKNRIVPRHIQLVVRNNEELSKLLGSVTITNGGVLPNIHQTLLPK